jgi:hypothetical protein
MLQLPGHYSIVPLADIQISAEPCRTKTVEASGFGKNIRAQSVCRKGAARLRAL